MKREFAELLLAVVALIAFTSLTGRSIDGLDTSRIPDLSGLWKDVASYFPKASGSGSGSTGSSWNLPALLGGGSGEGAGVLHQSGVTKRCRYSVESVMQEARSVAREKGIPEGVFLALLASETGFMHFGQNSQGGTCDIIFNSAGAYGVGQIYRPQGGYWVSKGAVQPIPSENQLHTEYSVAGLRDLRTSLRASADILLGFPGSWETRVAWYQGLKGNTDDPKFIGGFKYWYNLGSYSGIAF